VTGYSSEEFINDPSLWLRIMHPEDRQAVREHVSHVLSSTQAPPLEHRIIHRNGDIRWVCNTPIHHCDNRGKMVGYDFLISDVTGQKQAFEEKTVLESQLRQSHKMEAIGTLAGGIAHDFNNILGAIIGYTGMALDDVHENAQEHYNMEQVLKASYRARDLVKQILTFSRQTEYTCKPVMIGPIVRETLKLLRASLPKTIDIKQNITKDDDVVAADPTEIHQILLNLCTNAYHAMRDSGGLLEVTMESLDVDSENAVLYPGISAGPYLKLTVKDTGCGMERIIMDRVFDPFFTTKSPAEGTGMGLSVVHGIVKSYRGAITLESEVDSGSTFHILLPRIKKKAQFIEESEGPLPRGTECIMFVDDEEVLTDMARRLLERLGYHVIAKTGSLEALDEFRKNPNSIDLVITDYTMPEMTGAELSMQMMRIRPDIPIILCTGFSEQITKEKAKLLGIREFVMKPIIVRELAAILRQIFDDTAPS
ncbi:MAG: response regulator, partial [Deltaproteobacteria bacterium]|nr:response regulator [Deltaproteobacteria bacterium]